MKVKSFIVSTFLLVVATNTFGGEPKSKGDVVGRDLLVTGLGWAGHIGIINNSNLAVLEVLNEPFNRVVQFNVLSNFKGKSPYWGAKYNGNFNNGDQIAWKGNEQSGRVDYTTIAIAVPSEYRSTCVEYETVFTNNCKKWVQGWTRGKFRCDSFVNWIYLSTGNGRLVEGLPRTVYSGMRYTR